MIGWLPDLSRWAAVAAHFLRPGGTFYMTEFHPVLFVFDDDEGVTEPRLRYPYFSRSEPMAFPVKGSYADRSAQVEQRTEYYWPHDLGEIVTSVASAGLRIEFLHEFAHLDEDLFPFLVRADDGTWRLPHDQPGEIPLLFSLKATKPR